MTAEQVHPSAKTPDTAPPVAVSDSWKQRTASENKQQPRSRRGCGCSCCLWSILIAVVILFLFAVAATGAILYALYRPHRPTFSVSALQLLEFNLTDTSLTSGFNLTLTARNPNQKITLVYDEISVKILCGDVVIGDGYIPGFLHGRKNVTTLKTVVWTWDSVLEGAELSLLKPVVRSGNLPVKIQLDTKFNKFGKVKAKKLRMRVKCDGINISVPTNKTVTFGRISNFRCQVDLRFKII